MNAIFWNDTRFQSCKLGGRQCLKKDILMCRGKICRICDSFSFNILYTQWWMNTGNLWCGLLQNGNSSIQQMLCFLHFLPYPFTLLAKNSAVNYGIISEHFCRENFISEWNYWKFSIKKISRKAIYQTPAVLMSWRVSVWH